MIEYGDYIIKRCECAPLRFDLCKKITRQSVGDGTKKEPKGKKYEQIVDLFYGITFEMCVKEIINRIINKKEKLNLEEALFAYRKESELFEKRIIELLKNFKNGN